MKTVVLDIDGVLADWSTGFSELARTLFPQAIPQVPIVSHYERQSWDDYPGMTKEMVDRTWKHVHDFPEFWRNLNPICSDHELGTINELICTGNHVYFVTNRRMPGAMEETRTWLMDYVQCDVNIVITHRKGEFCKTVNADYYIDDKSENVDCAIWMTDKKTKSYVLTRPYNSGIYAPHSNSARRIETVSKFLEDISNGV